MSSSTLSEMFGHIVVSFTQSVTEQCNPDEPKYTGGSFGFDSIASTGREWYYYPVDEFIFQEYSETTDTVRSSGKQPYRHIEVRVTNACVLDEEKDDNQHDEDRAMAWKRLRPSAFYTVCKSMFIGASISPLVAIPIGSLFTLFAYLCYKTFLNCQFSSRESIPKQIQWINLISQIIGCAFLYMWFFLNLHFLFRPYQLIGVRTNLLLVTFFVFGVHGLYRVCMQELEIPLTKPFTLQTIPLNLFFLISIFWQVYLLTKHFQRDCSWRQRFTFFFQLILPSCFGYILAFIALYSIYPAYEKQSKQGQLLIAIFSPLVGIVLKVISRISVQRLWNISHPGHSFVLLAPVYFGSALMFRILQADLHSFKSIAITGIVHGGAELIERSMMVFIDHTCHVIWKRSSAPWGHFRTPRRERLMADIAIMSMLYESASIVSVNGVRLLYQWIYLKTFLSLHLFKKFALRTAVAVVIEWFFTSLSLAIETHYQNMAVMAVWRKKWKRHMLVAVVNAVALAIWASGYLIDILQEHVNENQYKGTCKMPFT
ncbi:uncharacterized protein [Montipora foliosa]|uniref:uncharacterized protein n=1 Tax=Montipora foliosa TaxID=591990 RepID=UPI0035F20DEE